MPWNCPCEHNRKLLKLQKLARNTMFRLSQILCHLVSSVVFHLVTMEMQQVAIISNRRCDNSSRMLQPAFRASHLLSCMATCRATTDCNSINFAPNMTERFCELLQTSEQDFSELISDEDWNFYTSHENLVSGNQTFMQIIELNCSCCVRVNQC